MKLTALIVACLATVALSGPVPAERYIIRRPQNSVNLHSAARQLTSGGQTFTVTLDDDDDFDSHEQVLNLRGVGNFATTQAGVSSTRTNLQQIQQQQQLPAAQRLNIGGQGRFTVEVDDDGELDISHESDEVFFSTAPCPAGQLRHGDRCVVPRINRNIFVFGREDEPEPKAIDRALIPMPQLDYNIIFVRSKPARANKPVIVPPPQKKTVVYVLEDEQDEDDGVITAPVFPDADPEVYYVKVRDGENPQLPGGLDLETAYSQAIRPLQSDDSLESSIELQLGAGGAGFRQSSLGNIGVPLSATQPQAAFNAAGGQGSVGVPLPSFQQAGHQGGPQAGGGDVGVPLPSFQGNADFSAQARSVNAGDQAFASAKNFEVEFDDGRLEIEPESQEAVQPALRYQVPQQG